MFHQFHQVDNSCVHILIMSPYGYFSYKYINKIKNKRIIKNLRKINFGVLIFNTIQHPISILLVYYRQVVNTICKLELLKRFWVCRTLDQKRISIIGTCRNGNEFCPHTVLRNQPELCDRNTVDVLYWTHFVLVFVASVLRLGS